MKKLGLLLLTLAIAALLVGAASAQGRTDDGPYFLTYYSNANTTGAPDETVRIINGGASNSSNLYANFYVFDDSEELTECCSCLVTPDGLLSESVNKQLTSNPVTGLKPTRGVIKVLASAQNDATTVGTGNNVLGIGLTGWSTHIQKLSSGYLLTEASMREMTLTAVELELLDNLCKFDALLSGKPCSCTPEDQDF